MPYYLSVFTLPKPLSKLNPSFFTNFSIPFYPLFSFYSMSSVAHVYYLEHKDLNSHLATEEYLLNQLADNQTLLYLWRAAPCVVIGKNQNPWTECFIPEIQRNGVKIGRRLSGGGTVYQDLGNLNFTFLCHRRNFRFTDQITIVLSALRALGISAESDNRYALWVKGRKFSGNAFCFRKGKVLHHGTLLINANLSRMHHYLQPTLENVTSKAISSVRANVLNLNEIIPDLQWESIVDAFTKQFFDSNPQKENLRVDDSALDSVEIGKLKKKYQSWQWIFGHTPPFEVSFPINHSQMKLTISDGRISKIDFFGSILQDQEQQYLAERLKGCRLASKSIKNRVQSHFPKEMKGPVLEKLLDWVGKSL